MPPLELERPVEQRAAPAGVRADLEPRDHQDPGVLLRPGEHVEVPVDPGRHDRRPRHRDADEVAEWPGRVGDPLDQMIGDHERVDPLGEGGARQFHGSGAAVPERRVQVDDRDHVDRGGVP